jgi:hypothetical protein
VGTNLESFAEEVGVSTRELTLGSALRAKPRSASKREQNVVRARPLHDLRSIQQVCRQFTAAGTLQNVMDITADT